MRPRNSGHALHLDVLQMVSDLHVDSGGKVLGFEVRNNLEP